MEKVMNMSDTNDSGLVFFEIGRLKGQLMTSSFILIQQNTLKLSDAQSSRIRLFNHLTP